MAWIFKVHIFLELQFTVLEKYQQFSFPLCLFSLRGRKLELSLEIVCKESFIWVLTPSFPLGKPLCK